MVWVSFIKMTLLTYHKEKEYLVPWIIFVLCFFVLLFTKLGWGIHSLPFILPYGQKPVWWITGATEARRKIPLGLDLKANNCHPIFLPSYWLLTFIELQQCACHNAMNFMSIAPLIFTQLLKSVLSLFTFYWGTIERLVTCPRSHSLEMAEFRFESKCPESNSPVAESEIKFRCKLFIKHMVPEETNKGSRGRNIYYFFHCYIKKYLKT